MVWFFRCIVQVEKNVPLPTPMYHGHSCRVRLPQFLERNSRLKRNVRLRGSHVQSSAVLIWVGGCSFIWVAAHCVLLRVRTGGGIVAGSFPPPCPCLGFAGLWSPIFLPRMWGTWDRGHNPNTSILRCRCVIYFYAGLVLSQQFCGRQFLGYVSVKVP